MFFVCVILIKKDLFIKIKFMWIRLLLVYENYEVKMLKININIVFR